MYIIETYYAGDLITEATHIKSGVQIITDAPPDNNGNGSSFSPTDLLAASLGSCMLTIMGIAGRTHGFNLDGTRLRITKIMASNPRRVAGIDVILDFPEVHFSESHRKIIEQAARTCPVALSLHPDIKQDFHFNFYEKVA